MSSEYNALDDMATAVALVHAKVDGNDDAGPVVIEAINTAHRAITAAYEALDAAQLATDAVTAITDVTA